MKPNFWAFYYRYEDFHLARDVADGTESSAVDVWYIYILRYEGECSIIAGIITELIKTIIGVRKNPRIEDWIIGLHCLMTIFWRAYTIQSLHTRPFTSWKPMDKDHISPPNSGSSYSVSIWQILPVSCVDVLCLK